MQKIMTIFDLFVSVDFINFLFCFCFHFCLFLYLRSFLHSSDHMRAPKKKQNKKGKNEIVPYRSSDWLRIFGYTLLHMRVRVCVWWSSAIRCRLILLWPFCFAFFFEAFFRLFASDRFRLVIIVDRQKTLRKISDAMLCYRSMEHCGNPLHIIIIFVQFFCVVLISHNICVLRVYGFMRRLTAYSIVCTPYDLISHRIEAWICWMRTTIVQ